MIANPFANDKDDKQAKSYHEYRPVYHGIPFQGLCKFVGRKFSKSLDVACGTGHSTEALFAQKVGKNLILS